MKTKTYTIPESMPRHIFRAYDIRGTVDKDMDEHSYYALGLVIGSENRELGHDQVVIGRDGRLSSPRLCDALIQGLMETGQHVVDTGINPSPVVYFARHHLNLPSAAIITGSHNPAEDNGIKLILDHQTLAEHDITALHHRLTERAFMHGEGRYSKHPIQQDYIKAIVSRVQLTRPLKVAIDCGHGATAVIAKELFTALGCDVTALYDTLDGNFPAHHPDPSVTSNMLDLKELVECKNADIGFAFDGDGDRLGVINNKGHIIPADHILMVFARDLLEQKPGRHILFDVKCTHHLPKLIEDLGGVAEMCPTGHALIKRRMLATHSELAGEMSGHIFFADDWYGFDDALFAAARLCDIICRAESPNQPFARLPQSFASAEIKYPIADDEKFDFMTKFIEEAEFNDAKDAIRIDGLRVEFDSGWGLLRASNTGAHLTARFEADNPDMLKTLQVMFAKEMERLGYKAN